MPDTFQQAAALPAATDPPQVLSEQVFPTPAVEDCQVSIRRNQRGGLHLSRSEATFAALSLLKSLYN